MLRGKVTLLCGYVALAIGCGGGKGVAAGSEQGACYPNGTCNPGLTCLSRLCVRLELDGGDANTGTAGGGGDTGTGGSAGNTGSIGLAGRGGSGNTGMAGGGGRAGTGGTGGSSGTGGTFPVAPHPPQPQIANYGGPVLTAPKVRPIFFVGDTDEAAIKSFLSELAAGSYWPATTSEYGVGPLTVLPAISKVAATTALSDDALRSAISANTTGTNPPWGAFDSSTVLFFAMPSSIIITAGGATCCTSFGGYHDEATVNGVAVPYVVACACPDFLGPGWDPLDERTAAMSHELVEVATDPFPRSDPAFAQANQANLVWSIITGGEVADMCVIQPDAYFVPPDGTYAVQRSWSNAAARLGHDPCVPAAPSIPYFNSMPVLDVVPYGNTGYETHGLLIPVGTSRTIALDLFSTGVVPRPWDVTIFSYEELYGGTRSLSFSLDFGSGLNGDVLKLTITTLRTNPSIGVNPFVILSSYGAPTDADYRSHVSMGLVTTN